jgi:hypothetical protein
MDWDERHVELDNKRQRLLLFPDFLERRPAVACFARISLETGMSLLLRLQVTMFATRSLYFDAGNTVICIEIGKSMQRTVSPALKSENQCRRRRRLH